MNVFLSTVLLLFSISSLTAQNWKPFNDSTFQLYEETSSTFPKKVELMYFTNVQESVTPFLYSSHLTKIDSNFDPEVTPFQCTESISYLKVNSSWFGDKIESSGNDVNLILDNQDTLHFDFEAGVGDTLWIMNSYEKIYGVCNTYAEENILGLVDSIKRFTIFHTDLFDNTIVNSKINGFQLVLGKQIGFYTFFTRSTNNPEGIIYQLIGDRINSAGIYSFTKGDVLKIPVGSIVQHKERYPYLNIYTTYEVLGITENISSFSIDYQKTVYNQSYNTSTNLWEDEVIDTSLETINYGNQQFLTNEFYSWIGANKYLYRITGCDGDTILQYSSGQNLIDQFCELDSIYSGADMDQSTFLNSYSYTESCGINNFTSTYYSNEIIYYSINGCTSGDQVFAGIEDLKMDNFKLIHVGDDLFKINSDITNGFLYYQDGRLVELFKNEPFSLRPNTIYLLEIEKDGKMYHQKYCRIE